MYIPACLSQLCPPIVLLRLVKVRVRDSAGVAVLGLKDGQSLTVDLHRGQLLHQPLNELKFRSALAAVPGN